MKRWLAIVGIGVAGLALGAVPALAEGPGDPPSTNCYVIAALVDSGQAHGLALSSLAGGASGGASNAATTSNQPPPKIAQPVPVTMTPAAGGGCTISVNPRP